MADELLSYTVKSQGTITNRECEVRAENATNGKVSMTSSTMQANSKVSYFANPEHYRFP
jgi:hypothetical protein